MLNSDFVPHVHVSLAQSVFPIMLPHPVHDKVLRVRSPMNLVGCHPNRMKDVVTATFQKIPNFPRFWSRSPLLEKSQTLLTDMERSRYGASNDVCFVVIRPVVYQDFRGGGGAESAPLAG